VTSVQPPAHMHRRAVSERLLNDPAVARAVREHSAETGLPEAATWSIVARYVNEIVPFFGGAAFHRAGYHAAGWLLDLFYKVTLEHETDEPLPADAIAVYLINHRSNADYVLVSYALAGRVALSYAVGEWARAFPLEHVFKAFGSYFVRRRYREPLYHAVLERYVQLAAREGVTQGIFLEGGLTRDGTLKPPKIGLLDYVLGLARDPLFRSRIHVVPVAVNYDRVLEDRSLLRELASSEGRERPGRIAQLGEVSRYVAWNLTRLALRRWQRYGRAAVTIGRPMRLEPWFAQNPDLFDLPKTERRARVQALCDTVMSRIGELIPVTPVPLACAAIQSLDRDFLPRGALLDRMADLRDVLLELNARVIRHDRDIAETFDRAWRMLRMRRVLAETNDGFAVMPRGRELISYYANSIAHLLGPFTAAVRARDALPIVHSLNT
jgi:glycerol-3-phosphate O-acyltransferase